MVPLLPVQQCEFLSSPVLRLFYSPGREHTVRWLGTQTGAPGKYCEGGKKKKIAGCSILKLFGRWFQFLSILSPLTHCVFLPSPLQLLLDSRDQRLERSREHGLAQRSPSRQRLQSPAVAQRWNTSAILSCYWFHFSSQIDLVRHSIVTDTGSKCC